MAVNLPRNPKPVIPDNETSINIFGYTPSLGWSIPAIIIFGLCLLGNTYHCFKYKDARVYHFLIAFGCIMELVGYGFRIGAHSNPFLLTNFVVQYFFIVTAPIFFSAAIYLSLAKVVKSQDKYRQYSLLSPKALVIVFVIADTVTIGVQVAGAALIGTSESDNTSGTPSSITPEQANDILLAGLCIQSFAFLIFLTLFIIFIYRIFRDDPDDAPKVILLIILLAAILVFLRTLFRLAESAAGVLSYLTTNENLFGGLETIPLLIGISLLTVFPLSRWLELEKSPRMEANSNLAG